MNNKEQHEGSIDNHSTSAKLDLSAIFPAKGDDRRPPDWLSRALMYAVIAASVAIFVWFAWGNIAFIVFDVVVSIFIALAIEPLVVRLIKHGWSRAFASLASLFAVSYTHLTLPTKRIV